MTRRRCLGCQDDHHCRHTAFVPAGSILVPRRYLAREVFTALQAPPPLDPT